MVFVCVTPEPPIPTVTVVDSLPFDFDPAVKSAILPSEIIVGMLKFFNIFTS